MAGLVYGRQTYQSIRIGTHPGGGRHRSAKAVAAGGGQSGKVAATTCHRAAGGGVGGAAVGGTGQRPAVHLALPALALHAVVDPPLAGPIPASAVLALSSGGDAAACRRRRRMMSSRAACWQLQLAGRQVTRPARQLQVLQPSCQKLSSAITIVVGRPPPSLPAASRKKQSPEQEIEEAADGPPVVAVSTAGQSQV